MKTTIGYLTEVLIDEGQGEIKFEIRINRNEDLFEIFMDDKQIAYGDWTNNLLSMLRDIIKMEDALGDF